MTHSGPRASLVAATAFGIGCAIAAWFTWSHVVPVANQYRLIPMLVNNSVQSLKYSCRTGECVVCLDGLRNVPDAIVFTGGSTFRYGVDFDALAPALPRPVVNCIFNDSRVDTYRSFFGFSRANQSGQVIFHGYNSWAINSPGTWSGDREANFFAVTPPAAPTPAPARIPGWLEPLAGPALWFADHDDLILLYAQLFLTRGASEWPVQFRSRLRASVPFYDAYDVAYWPLSKEAHWRRRLAMMRRWFSVSAYASSFIIDAQTLQPREEIIDRHERFLASAAPSGAVVFFPGPELFEAFPDHVRAVMRESKQVFLETLARHPAVLNVDVDYRACGLAPADFWLDSVMMFDIAHVNHQARQRVTECLADALERAGVNTFISSH